MARFAARLAEAAPNFASAVVPVAETVAKALTSNRTSSLSFSMPNVSARRRPESFLDKPGAHRALPAVPRVCTRCGRILKKGGELCRKCADQDLAKSFAAVLTKGRLTSHGGKARTKRAATLRRNAEAVRQWNPGELPTWLTARTFASQVVPALKTQRTVDVSRCLASSVAYAAQVRSGERLPHARHWVALARLVGLTAPGQ
jgi:hypothetical protein